MCTTSNLVSHFSEYPRVRVHGNHGSLNYVISLFKSYSKVLEPGYISSLGYRVCTFKLKREGYKMLHSFPKNSSNFTGPHFLRFLLDIVIFCYYAMWETTKLDSDRIKVCITNQNSMYDTWTSNSSLWRCNWYWAFFPLSPSNLSAVLSFYQWIFISTRFQSK